ncbi:hypothetical protein DFJ73DRAFT_761521 [Zopfochytrium polystomum]|nr:hypothetical protein DFJ73DRAFT_761521 [Zopfochytrium polystomum]
MWRQRKALRGSGHKTQQKWGLPKQEAAGKPRQKAPQKPRKRPTLPHRNPHSHISPIRWRLSPLRLPVDGKKAWQPQKIGFAVAACPQWFHLRLPSARDNGDACNGQRGTTAAPRAGRKKNGVAEKDLGGL